MLWSLKYHKTTASECDFVLHAFDPYLNTNLHEHKMEQFALFSEEQSKAVCCFLQLMSTCGEDNFDKEDAAKALIGYWVQFCDVNRDESGCGTIS